jgi:hypothetical protein
MDDAAIPYKRLLLFVQRRHHRRKVLPAPYGQGMLGAEVGFADGQGALMQGAGAIKVALFIQGAGEVAEAPGGAGVVGPRRAS